MFEYDTIVHAHMNENAVIVLYPLYYYNMLLRYAPYYVKCSMIFHFFRDFFKMFEILKDFDILEFVDDFSIF